MECLVSKMQDEHVEDEEKNGNNDGVQGGKGREKGLWTTLQQVTGNFAR